MAAREKYDEARVIEQLHNQATCKAAFGKVIEHYSSQLYWQIRRLVIDHDDANDVLQNTFMKAWTSIDNFRGDAKLSTWLYKIAINESITFVNKKKVMNQLSIDDDESFLVNQLESDEWFDGDQAQINLQKAIATLPDVQRTVFNLRYYDNMKYSEMSQMLKTSEGALKASYHHAVQKVTAYVNAHK